MVKQKKKRNKVYRGQDSSVRRPSVIRVEAANRNKISQWWFEKKSRLKPLGIAALVVLAIIWLVYELLRAVL